MKKLLLLPVIILALSACSTLKVSYDVDGSVDFTQFKTFEYYGWAEESDRILNQLDRNRIEKSFGSEFAKRGLNYVEKGGDLVVVLFIVVEQKTEVSANTSGGGYYGGYGGYYGYGPRYGWGPTYIQSSTVYNERAYSVGTLIASAYDSEKEELIWEAIGTKNIDRNSKTLEEDINRAVAKIMSTYPIQPSK